MSAVISTTNDFQLILNASSSSTSEFHDKPEQITFENVLISADFHEGKHLCTSEFENDTSKEDTDDLDKTNSENKRSKISMEIKKQLVEAHDNGNDFLELGLKLGVKACTVKRIIYKWRKYKKLTFGRIGGHKKPLITDEIGGLLIRYIEQNHKCQLLDMKEYLKRFGIDPDITTISNYLCGKCLALKFTENASILQNSTQVKEERFIFVKSMLDEGTVLKQCIYIDLCHFNFWIKRFYRKCEQGERMYRQFNELRGQNVILAMASSINGIIHYQIYDKEFAKADYDEFINCINSQLDGENCYIIQNINSIRYQTNPNIVNLRVKFLPQCSDFLSPIEPILSAIKSNVKSILYAIKSIPQMKKNERRQLLHTTVMENVVGHWQGSCEKYFYDCLKFYPPCLNREDILMD